MADENANPPPSDTTTPPPTETPPPTGTPPAGERTFTQADVDRIVNERLARDRQRRAEPARTTNAQPTAAPPQNTQPPPSTIPVTFDADAFNDALSEFPFDKEQRGVIREAARRESPADMDGFVAKWARMFGKKQPGPPPTPAAPATGTQPAQPANPTVVATPPVTSRGTPPPTSTPTDDTPIMSMSEADKKALADKIGATEFTKRHLRELASRGTRIRPR